MVVRSTRVKKTNKLNGGFGHPKQYGDTVSSTSRVAPNDFTNLEIVGGPTHSALKRICRVKVFPPKMVSVTSVNRAMTKTNAEQLGLVFSFW